MLKEFNDLISRWRQHPVAHTQHGRATNRSHKYEGLDK